MKINLEVSIIKCYICIVIMNNQHKNREILEDTWDIRGLVFFGYWALRKHQFGHGLLIFHATALGVKVGNILHFKWNIFKMEKDGDYVYFDYNTIEVEAGNGEILKLDYEIIKQSEIVYNTIGKYNADLCDDDFIYINSTTGKVITTSTLKRELKNLYKKTKDEVKDLTGCELMYREIETNVFELAWAREMVRYYRYTKQAFIKVSKRMGHRTLKDTIALLELDMMDEVELKFDFYDKTDYPYLANNIDTEIDLKVLEQKVSGLKYSLNGRVYNTKKSEFTN